MWLDGVGFSAPLIDPKQSKVVETVGFAVVPKGPKAQHSASFVDAMGIPAASRNKGAAYLYCQWATGKKIMAEILRTGSGTPARLSVYTDPDVVKHNIFGREWLNTVMESQKISAPGPAGDRAGHRVPRHVRRRADQYDHRLRSSDRAEEGDGRLPAGAR